MKTIDNVSRVKIRRAVDRGHADHGWLDSWHTFSFADYYDSRHMGFRSLRVINEDRVSPGEGFGMHLHQDMEIFSYVVEGALAHKDSMGHASTVKAGEVQKITAGKGIMHSEFNATDKERVHFYQIWIVPNKKGLAPSYQEQTLPLRVSDQPLVLVGAPQGTKALLQFNQDAYVFGGFLSKGRDCRYDIKDGRGIWLQVVKGQIEMSGVFLLAGDGASLEEAGSMIIKAQQDAEFLLFDLA